MAFELGPHEDIGSRLRAAGVEAGDIRYLVNTHLHFDHTGGNALIPQTAELVVHRTEWAAAHDPEEIIANFYVAADFEDGRPRLEVEGDHDLFGDGRIVLFETPGHTPGHMSVRLRMDDGDVVLVGDACYFEEWIDTEESPPIGRDKTAELASVRRLRAMRLEPRPRGPGRRHSRGPRRAAAPGRAAQEARQAGAGQEAQPEPR